MGIGISSIKFRSETRGAVDLSFLQACIGEKIKVITELYFDQIYMASDVDDRRAFFAPTQKESGQYYNDNLVIFEDGDYLNNCQVGDTFKAYSVLGLPAGSYILTEIINGGMGRFNVTFPVPQFIGESNGEYVANISPLKSLVYQFGINSSGQFVSLTDGSGQKSIIDSATALTDVVSQALSPLGLKDWQIDTITLVGQGDDAVNYPVDTHVRIKITHEAVVTPFYLPGQFVDMQNGIAPDYFKADNDIKYFAQIDWNKSNTFSDPAKSLQPEGVGQFSWFNVRGNGGPATYSISSLTFERVSDAEMVDQLEYEEEVEVKFVITSTGNDFHATNTGIVFGFNYLPEDESFFQNTNRLLKDNFCFDSLLVTPDGSTDNGAYFGTADQVIKTVKAEILTSTTARVTVRVAFGANRLDILRQADVAQYAIWCIVERTDTDIEVSDKVNLLVQAEVLYEQLTTVDLLDAVTVFVEHPYDLIANGESTLEMFPVDDVAVNSTFTLDFTGHENEGILLRKCTPKLVLVHATEADIVLDSFDVNLDNYDTVGTAPAVQSIDFNQQRTFKVENGIRKTISFQRDYDQDTASTKYYVLNFPFMNRWEYWLKIAGLTSLPSSLFDPAEDFNGANNFWNRLINTSGWSLKYRVTFQIEQNGELFEQEFEYALTSVDYDAGTNWNNNSIKSYDLTTDDEIVVGPKKYAYKTKDTKIVCSFDYIGAGVLNANDVCIVLWAEGFEGGGISEITRISSIHPVIEDSFFASVDDTDLVKVTKTGDTFTGEAILRFDKIQNFSKLQLYARIYEIETIDEDTRVTNDFILRITNDGFARLILS